MHLKTASKLIPLCVPQGQKGVGCFSWLWDEEAHVVTEDGRVAVKEIWGKVHHNGELC